MDAVAVVRAGNVGRMTETGTVPPTKPNTSNHFLGGGSLLFVGFALVGAGLMQAPVQTSDIDGSVSMNGAHAWLLTAGGLLATAGFLVLLVLAVETGIRAARP